MFTFPILLWSLKKSAGQNLMPIENIQRIANKFHTNECEII